MYFWGEETLEPKEENVMEAKHICHCSHRNCFNSWHCYPCHDHWHSCIPIDCF
uniref:Uncharacterized protein n=1 Tax=Bos indicus x Bos taurus TaxID=30522 RepID=A0A4W2GTG9_BOBOX